MVYWLGEKIVLEHEFSVRNVEIALLHIILQNLLHFYFTHSHEKIVYNKIIRLPLHLKAGLQFKKAKFGHVWKFSGSYVLLISYPGETLILLWIKLSYFIYNATGCFIFFLSIRQIRQIISFRLSGSRKQSRYLCWNLSCSIWSFRLVSFQVLYQKVKLFK